MENIVNFIVLVFVIGSLGILGLFLVLSFSDYSSKNDYAYIDTSGSLGFADYCNIDRGNLYCRAGDKTIDVKEFIKKDEEFTRKELYEVH